MVASNIEYVRRLTTASHLGADVCFVALMSGIFGASSPEWNLGQSVAVARKVQPLIGG
jgi:hypothetical protein